MSDNPYIRLHGSDNRAAARGWDDGYAAGFAFAAGRAAATPGPPSDRNVARMFHEAYERLAPEFGYHTREESAVPWEMVPARNRDLMTATVGEVRAHLAAASPDERLRSALAAADRPQPPPDERLREAAGRLAKAVARVCGEGHPALAAWRVALAAATPDPPDARLDAVYAERNAVVLGLAKAGLMLGWRVGKASDPNEPDWPVVYIDTPAGQVSWHFRAADVPDWVEPYPGEWDRHSDREKYERLERLPAAPAASPDERLREALREIVAAFPPTPDREMDEEEVDQWYADHGDWFQRLRALTAADREKPGYYDHDHAADAPPVPDPETSS